VNAPNTASYDPEYFRRLYGEVPAQSRWDRGRDARIERIVLEHAPLGGGALLDVGCGYGYLLGRFRDRYRSFGVELSGHAGPVARGRGAHVVQADLQGGLPFAQAAFEVVVAVNVIEHLLDPAAGVRAIGEVLRSGGLCVVHLPTISGPVSRGLYRLFYAGDPTHVYRPSGREVRALFEDQGFRTLDHSHAPHVPRWLWRAVTWNPAYLAAFRRV
jgi:SAM-dependent methyltransferase